MSVCLAKLAMFTRFNYGFIIKCFRKTVCTHGKPQLSIVAHLAVEFGLSSNAWFQPCRSSGLIVIAIRLLGDRQALARLVQSVCLLSLHPAVSLFR